MQLIKFTYRGKVLFAGLFLNILFCGGWFLLSKAFYNTVDDILKNTELSIPTPLKFEELEDLVASYGNQD